MTVWSYAAPKMLKEFPYDTREDHRDTALIVPFALAPLVPKEFTGAVYTVPPPNHVTYDEKRKPLFAHGLVLFRAAAGLEPLSPLV